MERTKNASRNIFFGTINKAVSLLLPFILRTILIRTLGVEYVGLGGLFASILQVLNLAELGISSAIVYSMYGAIASKDDQQICQLMNLYKRIYRVIGLVILASGCAVAPFLRFFISGTIPEGVNLYVLYFINLGNACLTYFLFAYKTCLFTAHQRNDIVSRVGTIVLLITHVGQGALLVLFKNYYLYVIVLPLGTIINNLVISFACSKIYPKYKAKGEVSTVLKVEIKKKVRSLFFYRIGSIVLSSIDTIVISSFLGLAELGKYNNYYYIITAIFGFLEVYYSSLTAGIGNSIKLESKMKNRKDFDRLFIIQGCLVAWCSACLLSLYQPFMRIWVGEDLMFPFGVVICLTTLFFSWKMMDIVNMYKNAAGLWEHDKWRPLVAAGVNLAINLLLVQLIGIYGIIISTIVSIIIVIFPWSSFVLFKYYFNDGNYKKEFVKYIKGVIAFFVLTIIVSSLTYFVCKLVPEISVWYLLLKVGICVIFPTLLIFAALWPSEAFHNMLRWAGSKFKTLIKKK